MGRGIKDVEAFVNSHVESCLLGPDLNRYVSKSDLYEFYKGWCRETGCIPYVEQTFNLILSRNFRFSKSGGRWVYKQIVTKKN